jgi:hypothetical protein
VSRSRRYVDLGELNISVSFGLYDSLSEFAMDMSDIYATAHAFKFAEPVVLVGPLQGNFVASFALGWGVTTVAGLGSYPLDTIR